MFKPSARVLSAKSIFSMFHSHLQHSDFWAAFFIFGQLRIFFGAASANFSRLFFCFWAGHFRALPYWHPRAACYMHTRKGLAHGQPLGSLGHTPVGLSWPRATLQWSRANNADHGLLYSRPGLTVQSTGCHTAGPKAENKAWPSLRPSAQPLATNRAAKQTDREAKRVDRAARQVDRAAGQ